MVKKLLDTAKVSGNPKVAKTGKKGMPFGGNVRMAQLSMMPDNILCAGSKAAGCMDLCLKDAGLAAVYRSVNIARQARTDFWHADREGFLSQLRHPYIATKWHAFFASLGDLRVTTHLGGAQ